VLKVPRVRALPTPFRPNCRNRVVTHERDGSSACCRVTGQPEANFAIADNPPSDCEFEVASEVEHFSLITTRVNC